MVHSNNPEHQLNEAKDIVINAIGETMDLYGINRSVGNLYGTMLFEGSMTLDEMREQLQMSKPSMSAGVKRLQEFDIVKQQFTRGSRKQHFTAEKNFLISSVISSHVNGIERLLSILKPYMIPLHYSMILSTIKMSMSLQNERLTKSNSS